MMNEHWMQFFGHCSLVMAAVLVLLFDKSAARKKDSRNWDFRAYLGGIHKPGVQFFGYFDPILPIVVTFIK